MSIETDRKEHGKSNTYKAGTWTGAGIAIGVALGAAFDNAGLGIAFGITIGAAIDGIAHLNQTIIKNSVYGYAV